MGVIVVVGVVVGVVVVVVKAGKKMAANPEEVVFNTLVL